MILDQISFIYDNLYIIMDLMLVIVIPLIVLQILSQMISKINDSKSIESSSFSTLLKIIRIGTFIVIFLAVLDVLGINLHSLFVSLGLVSVAASLATKDALSNIISGIILLLEKKFQKGDMIEIDGQKGKVVKMGFKSVQLLSSNGLITIPNVLFTTKSFVNYTQNGYYMVPFNITITNNQNLSEVLDAIEETLEGNKLILKEPKHKIFVRSISTAGVEILIKVAIENPLNDFYVVSELIRQLKEKIEFEDL